MNNLILLDTNQQSFTKMCIMFALMFIVFYFFMIRPQLKRQKLEKMFYSSLKKGDKVVTNGGEHGIITEINNDTCILETLVGKIKYERNAISKALTELRYTQKK